MPFTARFPIENGDFPQLCDTLPEGNISLNHHSITIKPPFSYGFQWFSSGKYGDFPHEIPITPGVLRMPHWVDPSAATRWIQRCWSGSASAPFKRGNIQRKRKLKGNHTRDIFQFDLFWSVLIGFDLFWFVLICFDLLAWSIFVRSCWLKILISPPVDFVSSILIVGQSLLISVSKLFGGWVTLLKNIFVIGDQHPMVIFEEIYQFWSQSHQP